jgi:uncharacterized membrane protein
MDERAGGAGVLFEAVIVPHRSLSRSGLFRLQAVIVGLCCLTALRFWMLGAWPVLAFSFVEIGVVVFLLHLNARRARSSEMVLLSEDALRVVRTDSRGKRQERRINPAWLNVVMEEAPGRVPKLWLVARGAREEIGAALGEHEKRDLAEALRTALYDARNPRFDNPQLREG